MSVQIRSGQSLSRVRLFATPWIAACQASLSITNSWSSLRLTSIESVMPSSHLILCRPLLLLPPIPPSIRVFSNESTLRMSWPKYWSFSFSIIPSKEIPGLISFRMDWLDLLAVQGTLRSLGWALTPSPVGVRGLWGVCFLLCYLAPGKKLPLWGWGGGLKYTEHCEQMDKTVKIKAWAQAIGLKPYSSTSFRSLEGWYFEHYRTPVSVS